MLYETDLYLFSMLLKGYLAEGTPVTVNSDDVTPGNVGLNDLPIKGLMSINGVSILDLFPTAKGFTAAEQKRARERRSR
jgi:hypothetical protein